MSIPILYVDDEFVLVNKPTSLLCVPGRGPDKQDCVLSRLQEAYPDALVVHRLDRDTSGVMLFARTLAAQRELNRQFEARETEKGYVALICGTLPAPTGLVDAPMRKDLEQRLPPLYIIDWDRGKPARTRWEVLDVGSKESRVRLFPETGRSHQLRVHMKFLQCPIAGDPIYGNGKESAPRLMLHAEWLTFIHPRTGESLSISARVPF